MKIKTVAGTRTLCGEPPRSTAYYYADLERLKRTNGSEPAREDQAPGELDEYVGASEVVNDGAVREVPPLRDRPRQWSLPEYHTPENSRKLEETYSTAGTFPMPEPKEKEPLLAELEVVGRLPLTQLESNSGVRRSRSWYLCCPNVAEEEISRESSWRYSSLRPVTAPPIAGQNGIHMLTAAQCAEGTEDPAALRSERDALARALSAERARAAAAARAHDARLAELHGVIAELVRRRALDRRARAIPEEEISDECESTTQPAGELDLDVDQSRTDQNDTSSPLSPAELPPPQGAKAPAVDASSDTSTRLASSLECGPLEVPPVEVTEPAPGDVTEGCDTSLNLSERDSELCLSTHRCCEDDEGGAEGEGVAEGADSCERERGSPPPCPTYAHSTGHSESRQAKLACRVKLRRTHDSDSSNAPRTDDEWCAPEAAERLALDPSAHAELREALLAARHHEGCAWAARCARLRAERRVLQCALARAADTAHRLYCACAVHESTSVALCCALRSADRALETYDVLLALAETNNAPRLREREAAELVARQVLARLDAEQAAPALGEPLLSPGPWLQHHNQVCAEGWSAESEARLRAHAARLKADTVALRGAQPPPKLFSYHDVEESELAQSGGCSAADMEAAVALLDALCTTPADRKSESPSVRRRPRSRPRHWLHPRASETPL